METYRELAEIAQQHGSPFYIFDKEAFTRNFRDIRAAFTQRYPHVIIGYSYKTNYIPYLCRLVQDLGGYAEVVSRLELDLALKLGCPPAEIIYNGPVKTADDIVFALNSGIIVNIDTIREVEFVTHFAQQQPETPIRIGLRINIALVDSQGKSHLQNGLPSGRFGFSDNALKAAVRQLRDVPNVRVCSLHGHTSSSNRSLWVYRTIAAKLAEVGERYFPETIEFLNVGGGFYGRSASAMGLSKPPTFDEYADAICEVLRQHPWVEARQPRLVIEPGMAVAADTMSFITQVFEVKRSGDQRLAVVDGSIFNVKPTLHPHNHPFSIVKKEIGAGPKVRYNIVGATCMEKDRLLQEIESVEIEREDFIHIENVGAYTVVMTPPFINLAPPIVVRGPKGYIAIRRRQDFNDIFGSYLF
jgi:diaminopimelate decarboxylase